MKVSAKANTAMNTPRFFLICVFTLSLSPALASEQGWLSVLYRRKTEELLQQLERSGVERVACRAYYSCVSAQDLRTTLQAVEFIELSEFSKPVGSTRFTAFFSPPERRIYLNTSVPHDLDLIPYLGLHELLGIMGWNEEDYHITLRILSFFRPELPYIYDPPHGRFIPEASPFSPSWASGNEIDFSNDRLFLEGGATVVGGAGDFENLKQTLKFYQYRNLWPETVSRDQIRIEVVDGRPQETIEYKLGYQSSRPFILAVVPRALISEPPLKDLHAPDRALEDISWFLDSVAPLVPHMNDRIGFSYPLGYPWDSSSTHPSVKKIWFEFVLSRSDKNRDSKAGSK